MVRVSLSPGYFVMIRKSLKKNASLSINVFSFGNYKAIISDFTQLLLPTFIQIRIIVSVLYSFVYFDAQ